MFGRPVAAVCDRVVPVVPVVPLDAPDPVLPDPFDEPELPDPEPPDPPDEPEPPDPEPPEPPDAPWTITVPCMNGWIEQM